ncbi:3-isopropylmalate dehydratase small subunit [Streptomyces natalensis]|uniref:3-isopropylmalate dehydratase small subunit n=1 Tax=Streptomyces natalensis ATCC 27448 TaxID=1240678 RepID=A0A0D7CFR5_9ACTN|nr:3-isopropylmalate dehydratase small subunit [Streptomyces natalensis]KIZ14881.1 isopropylmalate isomerase [Streptomyces natalensis ATCC 27448]
MKPLLEHTGYGVALRRGDVDTDQIIAAEYCKRLTKSGYADVLFAGWRKDPAFVLNRPASSDASILVAGHNFGTGSSREHAVWALRDWGFAVVIASSFGDIFRRNAFKNGLLAVELPTPVVAELADRVDGDPRAKITVDLAGLEVRSGGLRHAFAVEARARQLLLEGLDEIAVTLAQDRAITTYEKSRGDWLPSVPNTPLRPVCPSTAKRRLI